MLYYNHKEKALIKILVTHHFTDKRLYHISEYPHRAKNQQINSILNYI